VAQSQQLDESRYMGILDISSAHAGILRGDPMNITWSAPARNQPCRPGPGPPGSVTQGCRDLAGSQGAAGQDIWGQVAADAHGTPLGAAAADLEKLAVVRASGPAYRTDLRRIITLCGRAG